MKTIRVVLISILCLVFILAPLSVITGCKTDEPSGYPLQTGAPLGGAISSAGLDLVLGGLAEGALSWAGGQACDFIFGLITGSGDKTEEELEGIKNKLDEMDDKLDDIKDMIKDIQDKLNDISEDLKIVKWDAAIGNMVTAITAIDETFRKVIRMTGDAKNNPASYQDEVASLSLPNGEILNSTTGVLSAVGVINNFMTGKSTQTSLLEMRRDNINEGLNYENVADSYDAFALFFTALIGWEVKGVELIVNAYAGQGKPEAAVSYLKEFYADKLVPQVEMFSSLVEQLVWGNNDMRWNEVILDQGF